MIKQTLVYIILFGSLTPVSGQEIVTGLITERNIRSSWEKLDKKKGLTAADTLELPFFDDFSKISVFPDQNRWQDNWVFINNTYSVNQRTAGIATFDAIDNSGRLYETAVSTEFPADKLTSKPLNLNYPASDNIYLSFFYERGGLADQPEPKDSLTLYFYAPAEAKWHYIWSGPDTAVTGFKPVIIKINDPKYLKKGFMFRFSNYASLSSVTSDPSMAGNCDQWNIDYVLLARNRNNADTIPADVAFTLPVRSMLKTYETMPWKQFRQVYLSEMGPWITIHYFNNDKIVRNVTRDFQIFDVYKNSVAHSFSSGAVNIPASSPADYNATLLYTFNTDNNDSALFRIKSILTTDAFDKKENDTIIYLQRFGKSFSFDDGSSESGYGINGQGSRNAMVAYKFRSFIKDTLRSVEICFNDSYLNANQRIFDLMVWDDNAGIPGNVIYSQQDMVVKQGDDINGFYSYILTDPQAVTGDFYVGWKQRSESFLNAGFDLNTPNGGRQFYWLNNWYASQAKGSLMIRPVFGPPISSTGISDVRSTNRLVRVWPNPAKEYIKIDAGDMLLQSSPVIKIFDLQGRELIKTTYSENIDVSSLPDGLYIIVLNINGRSAVYSRFVKSR
jgi:hypothetical protein